MALGPEPTAPFRAVRHALRVLDVVSRRAGGGVPGPQLAREAGLAPARLDPLLRMLLREEYVRRIPDGAYVPGPSLLLLGSTGAAREAAAADALRRALGALRDAVGAAVYVAWYVDGEIAITQCADGPGTPRVHEWVDFRSAAHAMAAGKCLLAQLDPDGRRDHLARHRAVRLTSRTTTSAEALLRRLDAQSPGAPVLDLQEYAVGTVCAAVPATAVPPAAPAGGRAAGCLALSLPVSRAHRLRHAARTLNREAAPVLLSLSI
ncbi:IclR family transcriptional regulator C-terminal domain-containing protein [Streptomyces sp. B1866]|uniref:IclR family transcriptional regulator domain-containing protein n=1 Tax=Streptomyces sp. B1866 TaxID=3075431 RepID=UPI00288EEA10|nr:IclR family transcriptional regulator C-terminal domain-containing protein [Streptomyces sp. B1866]MDT3399787.1 IclR family transcriptional regulator C-terminal domain-containing protein [Streptomyces sp. B1866]